jgi:hypothetical protein
MVDNNSVCVRSPVGDHHTDVTLWSVWNYGQVTAAANEASDVTER